MTKQRVAEEYSADETSRRLDAALKRSVQMKPKPHKPKSTPGQSHGKRASAKKRAQSV